MCEIRDTNVCADREHLSGLYVGMNFATRLRAVFSVSLHHSSVSQTVTTDVHWL